MNDKNKLTLPINLFEKQVKEAKTRFKIKFISKDKKNPKGENNGNAN